MTALASRAPALGDTVLGAAKQVKLFGIKFGLTIRIIYVVHDLMEGFCDHDNKPWRFELFDFYTIEPLTLRRKNIS
jgi:hypothetical protein